MTDSETRFVRPGARELLARVALDITPLRTSPPFRRLWIGQTISFVGSEINQVASAYQVYSLTHSTLAVGLLAFTVLVPLLTFTLVGGAIADAVDRRRLALVTETGLAVIALGFTANAALPHPSVAALFVLSSVGSSVYCLGAPGLRSLVPRLVEPDQLPAASALEGVYSTLGAIAGPALGGVLIASIGLRNSYLVDFATFAASLWSVWTLPAIRPAADADRPSLASIVDGFRYVRRQPAILGIFLVDTNAMIFGMPSALFPALADVRFGGGAQTVGFLYAAPYAGALVALLVSGWVSHSRRHGLIVAVAAASWGAAIAAFGFAHSLWIGLVLLAVAGGADAVSAIFRSAMVLRITPDELRGRVTGIEFTQVASAPTLGNVEAGLLASLTSLRFSIVSGGVACVIGTAVIALALPALRRYDAKASA